MGKKTKELTLEEKLEQALVPVEEQPYEVPENWCWVHFGNVCRFENGYAFKSSQFDDNEGVPVIRISNIFDGIVDVESCKKTLETEVDEKFFVEQGDLLIAMSGATTGKNGIYTKKQKAYFNQRVGNIKIIDENVISKRFRDYYIANKQEEILNSAYGGAQPNISSGKICDMLIAIPPLAEQHRMVGCIERLFSKLDEAKVIIEAIIESYQFSIDAIVNAAITGSLTDNWRKENKIDFASWVKVPIKDVCKVNPKKINANEYDDEMEVTFIPMVGVSEISGRVVEPQVRKLKEVKSGFTNFQKGDVVFAKITPCMENGKSAVVGELVNGIGYGTTEFYVLRCSEKLNNRYLHHILRSSFFRGDAKAVMTGAVGQQRVPKSFIENYIIPVPSMNEQIVIAGLMDMLIEKELKVKEIAVELVDSIELMKKTILAKAFRGELGTNDKSEESSLELLKNILYKTLQ